MRKGGSKRREGRGKRKGHLVFEIEDSLVSSGETLNSALTNHVKERVRDQKAADNKGGRGEHVVLIVFEDTSPVAGLHPGLHHGAGELGLETKMSHVDDSQLLVLVVLGENGRVVGDLLALEGQLAEGGVVP